MRMRGVKGCVSVIVIGRIVCDVTVGVAVGGAVRVVTSEEYPSPMECGRAAIKHSCGFRNHINVKMIEEYARL